MTIKEHGESVGTVAALRARIHDLEIALLSYHTFHHNYEIREGHRKRCKRWRGFDCDCGGDDIEAMVQTALGITDSGEVGK